jgi:hypothetical protein
MAAAANNKATAAAEVVVHVHNNVDFRKVCIDPSTTVGSMFSVVLPLDPKADFLPTAEAEEPSGRERVWKVLTLSEDYYTYSNTKVLCGRCCCGCVGVVVSVAVFDAVAPTL